jgi:hypothetical protein
MIILLIWYLSVKEKKHKKTAYNARFAFSELNSYLLNNLAQEFFISLFVQKMYFICLGTFLSREIKKFHKKKSAKNR